MATTTNDFEFVYVVGAYCAVDFWESAGCSPTYADPSLFSVYLREEEAEKAWKEYDEVAKRWTRCGQFWETYIFKVKIGGDEKVRMK